MFAVAKFFTVDPSVVEYDWYYVDYLDRLEYVLYQGAIKYEVHKRAESNSQ